MKIFFFFFKGWWHLVTFIDHYIHFYEVVRHQLSYMQIYNTQHAYNLLQNTRYFHSGTSLFQCSSMEMWWLDVCERRVFLDGEIWTQDLPSTSLTGYQLSCPNWIICWKSNSGRTKYLFWTVKVCSREFISY